MHQTSKMRKLVIYIFFLIPLFAIAQFTEKQPGYAIVNGDSIKGMLAINFSANSIRMDVDDNILMFFSGIEKVVLTSSNEIYTVMKFDGNSMFFKKVVEGKLPLYERNEEYYSMNSEELIMVDREPKNFFALFGKKKKEVRDYAFVHNISLKQKEEVITVFKYYNNEFSAF